MLIKSTLTFTGRSESANAGVGKADDMAGKYVAAIGWALSDTSSHAASTRFPSQAMQQYSHHCLAFLVIEEMHVSSLVVRKYLTQPSNRSNSSTVTSACRTKLSLCSCSSLLFV